MIKRLSIYCMCFLVSFMPVLQAQANPLALAIPLFIDAGTAEAITVAGSAVSFKVIANAGTDLSPYYSTDGTLSAEAYSDWFSDSPNAHKSITKSIATALGLVRDDKGKLAKEVSPVKDGELYIEPAKGYYWACGSTIDSSPTNVAQAICARIGAPHCGTASITRHPKNPDLILTKIMMVQAEGRPAREWAGSGQVISKRDCVGLNPNAKFKPSTCSGVVQETNKHYKPVESGWLQKKLMEKSKTLSQKELKEIFVNDKGEIVNDVAEKIETPPPPTMPNGSALPKRGADEWKWANSIVKGTAQSDDENADNYVPPARTADAEYLAHDVAKDSDTVTRLNSTTDTPVIDANPSTDTNTTGTVSLATVESLLSSIDSKLDAPAPVNAPARPPLFEHLVTPQQQQAIEDEIEQLKEQIATKIKETKLIDTNLNFNSGNYEPISFMFRNEEIDIDLTTAFEIARRIKPIIIFVFTLAAVEIVLGRGR